MKQFIFRQKYRFDLGTSFLTIINFCLLIISASDKIKTWINIEAKYLMLILVPASLLAVWLFGYILDIHLKYVQGYNKEANERNELLNEILEKLKGK